MKFCISIPRQAKFSDPLQSLKISAQYLHYLTLQAGIKFHPSIPFWPCLGMSVLNCSDWKKKSWIPLFSLSTRISLQFSSACNTYASWNFVVENLQILLNILLFLIKNGLNHKINEFSNLKKNLVSRNEISVFRDRDPRFKNGPRCTRPRFRDERDLKAYYDKIVEWRGTGILRVDMTFSRNFSEFQMGLRFDVASYQISAQLQNSRSNNEKKASHNIEQHLYGYGID